MATSGKKGKKSKGKAMTLQNFLAEDGATPGVTQVAKKVRNRGDEDGDEDDTLPQIYSLPTAPRASRMLDDTIPRDPPFQAYLANLSFDVREDDIYDFFEGYNIESLRLPREDGETGRLRGFGYIKFGTREDLLNAVSIADPHIKNRRVRIDVSNESDQNQRRGNRSRYDGFGPSENRDRESTNWRRANDGGPRDDDRRGGGGGGYGYNRDRPRDSSAETGNWRAGDRPTMDTSPGRRGGGGGGGGFGGRRNNNNDDYRKPDDAPQQERPKLNLKPRTLPLPEIVTQDEAADSEERIPTPEPPKPKSSGAASEKVFGSAKPVDTAAREKEIEERLERERLEKIKKQEENERQKEDQEKNETENGEKETEEYTEKDEKENRNTISWRNRDDDEKRGSPDRRGPPIQRRNDDRKGGGRDNRDNRDRRDFNRGYERDNKPRDSRDSRDRNDRNDRDNYNRDRGYSKENKNATRDNKHRDEKPKQDSRPAKTKTPAKSTGPPTASSQPPKSGPVLSSSNKYAVFIDEEELSE